MSVGGRPNGRPPTQARRETIRERLKGTGEVTIGELAGELRMSPSTIRRDVDALAGDGLLRRTHGGAVLPARLGEVDPFARRVETSVAAKVALAVAAAALLEPGQTVFLDASSSAHFAALRLVELQLPLTVITNGLPTMRVLAVGGGATLAVIGLGGDLDADSCSLVGRHAETGVRRRYADWTIMSAATVAADGTLTDADPRQAAVKRLMFAHARQTAVLVEAAKVGPREPHPIVAAADVSLVLLHGGSPRQRAALERSGARVTSIG